jgi:actin related protein 2/3 complex subunit 5
VGKSGLGAIGTCKMGGQFTDHLFWYRYKGMAASSSPTAKTPTRGSSGLTPQSTGFSQMGGRPGAANESSGAAMSVLLSWHEKVVDVAGLGCVTRSMTDWRKV